MHFEGETVINAPRQRVWEYVSDPNNTLHYVPLIKKLEIHDKQRFSTVVGVGVGSISGTFRLDFLIEKEIPPSFTKLVATGSGIKSTVGFEALVDLSEITENKTLMKWSSEANVGGLIAGVGQRLLRMAAEKTMNQLFERLRSNLESQNEEKR